MRLSKEQLLDMLHRNATRGRQATDGCEYFELYQAALRGELEIEGYGQETQWHKFNPNDIETFPPSETPVEFIAEVYVDGEILNSLMIGIRLQNSPYFIQSGGVANQFSYADVVWWRHLLPPPPQEEK